MNLTFRSSVPLQVRWRRDETSRYRRFCQRLAHIGFSFASDAAGWRLVDKEGQLVLSGKRGQFAWKCREKAWRAWKHQVAVDVVVGAWTHASPSERDVFVRWAAGECNLPYDLQNELDFTLLYEPLQDGWVEWMEHRVVEVGLRERTVEDDCAVAFGESVSH